MFKDLKAYPRYGRAGLPQGWDVVRTASVARLLVSNVDKLSNDGETPVQLCNYVDVYRNDYISRRLNFMQATATPTEIQAFSVRQGDVLITKDSESWTDIGVPAYVPGDVDGVVCGYHLAMLRPLRAGLLGEYLFRVLQVPSVAAQLHVAATGVTRYGLSQGSIRELRVPLPSPVEQAAIVKYLGHAHARIDLAIATKRKLISLLEEQKQAIINQAVTRGLGPTAPMKDSGIPWLGDIPNHWGLVPARRVSRVYSGSTPSRAEPRYWATADVPWVASSAISQVRVRQPTELVSRVVVDERVVPTAPAGSVLVGLVGQGRTRGAAAILEIEACINQNVAAMVPSGGLLGEYLFAVMTAGYGEIRSLGRGGNQAALNGDLLRAFKIPLPPLDEQRAIVAHIAAETATADTAIDRTHREIELLREFRTRLTSDVVTGQLDVRHIAETLPDLDPGELADDVGPAEDDLVDEAAEFLEGVDA